MGNTCEQVSCNCDAVGEFAEVKYSTARASRIFIDTENEQLYEAQLEAPKQGLRFVNRLVFENSVKYRGYLMGELRHGPGIETWPDGG